MTPKEIPLELLCEYHRASDDDQKGKYCSLIVDDEVIKDQNGDDAKDMTPKKALRKTDVSSSVIECDKHSWVKMANGRWCEKCNKWYEHYR